MTTPMVWDPSDILQPLAWLVLLVSLSFRSDLRAASPRAPGTRFTTEQSAGFSLKHRIFGTLVVAKLVAWAGHLLIHGIAGSGEWYVVCGRTLSWAAFATVAVCSVALITEITRDALEPVPNVIEPAIRLERWIAGLVIGVVVAADLPLMRLDRFGAWLAEERLSCDLCLFFFEVALLLLLATNLRRLGLFLRRRSVGTALGLALLGCADTLRGLARALPSHEHSQLLVASSVMTFCAIGNWVFYVLISDRPRLPHALNSNSLLRTWHELAPEFSARMRPDEKTPFIAGIEAQVRTVLAKYGVKQGAQ